MPTLRTDLAEIVQDCVPDLAHQGISLTLPLLRPSNVYRFAFPIELIQAKQPHFAAAKSIYGKKQQNRMITNVRWVVASRRSYESLHVGPRGAAGQAFEAVHPRGINRGGQS
ncbi:MAG: hypothetical protein WA254_22280 [Candidatus Sulfotelmatobacter sp.]